MSTVIIGAIVFGCIGLAARNVYMSKKKGKGCSGCSGCEKKDSGSCH